MYIKNILDNLSKSFLIHEINGCPYMILKEIHVIFVSMIICSIVDHLINTSTWRKRNRHYSVLIQKAFLWKETSTYWKLKDEIFKACAHYFYHFFYLSPDDSPLKAMKNIFYFIWKALFVLEIFKLLHFRLHLSFSLSALALEVARR